MKIELSDNDKVFIKTLIKSENDTVFEALESLFKSFVNAMEIIYKEIENEIED